MTSEPRMTLTAALDDLISNGISAVQISAETGVPATVVSLLSLGHRIALSGEERHKLEQFCAARERQVG